MATEEEILQARLRWRRRRRVELARAGGFFPAVADHVFEGAGSGLTPSPAITAGQVVQPVTFVARTVSQLQQGDTVFISASNAVGMGFQTLNEIALIAPGFGLAATGSDPVPYTSGRIVFVLGIDPANTRAIVQVNGITVFDDTNAGLTNWGIAGETFQFGNGTSTIYESFEIYLNRLPSVA